MIGVISPTHPILNVWSPRYGSPGDHGTYVVPYVRCANINNVSWAVMVSRAISNHTHDTYTCLVYVLRRAVLTYCTGV